MSISHKYNKFLKVSAVLIVGMISSQAALAGMHTRYSEALENRFLTKCRTDAVNNGLSRQESNRLCLCILKGSSEEELSSSQIESILDDPDGDLPDRFAEVVASCI